MKYRQAMRWSAVIAVVVMLSVCLSTQAFAGSVTLTLVQSGSLVNVSDAAGIFQHQGGYVYKGSTVVGRYVITRRATYSGTSAYNAAAETVTLMFGSYAYNVTLQGAHYFGNGRFYGSVSAGGYRYTWIQGSDAYMYPSSTVGTDYLIINWPGSYTLTLP